MNDAKTRAYWMLMGGLSLAPIYVPPDPPTGCDPYTRAPHLAANINLAEPLVRVDHLAANATLCEVMT